MRTTNLPTKKYKTLFSPPPVLRMATSLSAATQRLQQATAQYQTRMAALQAEYGTAKKNFEQEWRITFGLKDEAVANVVPGASVVSVIQQLLADVIQPAVCLASMASTLKPDNPQELLQDALQLLD